MSIYQETFRRLQNLALRITEPEELNPSNVGANRGELAREETSNTQIHQAPPKTISSNLIFCSHNPFFKNNFILKAAQSRILGELAKKPIITPSEISEQDLMRELLFTFQGISGNVLSKNDSSGDYLAFTLNYQVLHF